MNGKSDHFNIRQENRKFQFFAVVWTIALTATATAVVLIIMFFPARAQSAPTTQGFQPARFALETAEINVNMLQSSGDNTQKVLFKINTATGEVWALQMATTSMVNPQITSASWVRVQPNPPMRNNLFQTF